MKISAKLPLLLAITLSALVEPQTAGAINWTSLLTFGYYGQEQKQKEPINRLKNYYPPSGSKKLNPLSDPLNQEEVKYAKKLLLEGQKENLDVIDKIKFFYDPNQHVAELRGDETPEIAIGRYFYKDSEKSKAMSLKHELGHFIHGDIKRPPIHHTYYPRLFKLTTALGAGLFALATNYGKMGKHTWLRACLALPAGLGMARLLFFGTNAVCKQKQEYAADTYAALNCPDATYIKAEIDNYYKKSGWSTPSDSLTPEELKLFNSLPPAICSTLYVCFKFGDIVKSNTLLRPLIDPEHPTEKNRIKNFEKIMKKLESEKQPKE